MASATGMPRNPPRTGEEQPLLGEEEPLLGEPGDAQQADDGPLYRNLVIGTGVLAQAGIWLMVVVVWAAVFDSKLEFFSLHPLLNSAGLLFVTQAVLVLQPTHTSAQKRAGTLAHASLHAAGVPLLLAGLVVIEVNKVRHGGAHFRHPHAALGVATYALLVLQSLFGVVQYWGQGLLGGERRAKALWKYHRACGYVAVVVGLATVCAAADTDYNRASLGIAGVAAALPSVLVFLGVVSRIKLQKLGFKQ